jgi:hypothetical protein
MDKKENLKRRTIHFSYEIGQYSYEIGQIPFPFGPPTHSRSSKSSNGHFNSLNNLKLPTIGRE